MRIECGFFGEFELLKGTKRKYLLVASEPTECYAINREDFRNIFMLDDRDIYVNFRDKAFERERMVRESYVATRTLTATLVEEIRIEIEKNPIKKF